MTATAPSGADARFPAFDILRIAAALGVIYSHSFILLGHPEPTIVVGRSLFTLGTVCVGLFFTVSGYLVSASWGRRPKIGAFARKRFARIWPGLFVCILVTTFVLGPLLTTRSLGSYLGDSSTWGYVGKWIGGLHYTRTPPGIFTTNPYPNAINGSLWTLPYEVLAYAAVLVIGLVRGFGRKWFMAAMTACILLAFELLAVGHLSRDYVFYEMSFYKLLMLGAWFAVGALVFTFGRIPGDRTGMISIVTAGVAIAIGRPALFIVATGILFIWLGCRSPAWATHIRRAGDPSYGMYIYAFPIQQTLIWAGLSGASPKTLFVAAAAVSVLFGYASWHLVERRSLSFLRPKNRRGDIARPVTLQEEPAAVY